MRKLALAIALFAAALAFVPAATADGPRAVRPRGNFGQAVARGVGFGLGQRLGLGFGGGFGLSRFGLGFHGVGAFRQRVIAPAYAVVQPILAAPVVQQVIADDCAGTAALTSGYGVQAITSGCGAAVVTPLRQRIIVRQRALIRGY